MKRLAGSTHAPPYYRSQRLGHCCEATAAAYRTVHCAIYSVLAVRSTRNDSHANQCVYTQTVNELILLLSHELASQLPRECRVSLSSFSDSPTILHAFVMSGLVCATSIVSLPPATVSSSMTPQHTSSSV